MATPQLVIASSMPKTSASQERARGERRGELRRAMPAAINPATMRKAMIARYPLPAGVPAANSQMTDAIAVSRATARNGRQEGPTRGVTGIGRRRSPDRSNRAGPNAATYGADPWWAGRSPGRGGVQLEA